MKKGLLIVSALLLALSLALPVLADDTAETEASISFTPGQLTLVVPGAGDPDRAMNLDFGTTALPISANAEYPALTQGGESPYAIYVEDARGNAASGWRLQAALTDFSATVDSQDYAFPGAIDFAGGVGEALYPLSTEEQAALSVQDMRLYSMNHSQLGAGAGALDFVNVATADATVRRNLFYLRWDLDDADTAIDMKIDSAYDLRELIAGEEYTATIHWMLNEQMEVNP